jgi:hypothetical protein
MSSIIHILLLIVLILAGAWWYHDSNTESPLESAQDTQGLPNTDTQTQDKESTGDSL